MAPQRTHHVLVSNVHDVGPLNTNSTSLSSVMNWGQITIYAKLNSRQRLVSFTSVKSYVWSSAENSRTCCFAGLPLLACLRFIASYAFLLRRVCSRLTFPLGYVWEQVVMVGFPSTCLCGVCMGCHGNLWAPVRLCLLPSSTWSMLISTDGFYHVLASNVCPLNTEGTSIKAPTVSCAAFSNCLEIVSLSCMKQFR